MRQHEEADDWSAADAQALAERLQALTTRVKQTAEQKMVGQAAGPMSEEEAAAKSRSAPRQRRASAPSGLSSLR